MKKNKLIIYLSFFLVMFFTGTSCFVFGQNTDHLRRRRSREKTAQTIKSRNWESRNRRKNDLQNETYIRGGRRPDRRSGNEKHPLANNNEITVHRSENTGITDPRTGDRMGIERRGKIRPYNSNHYHHPKTYKTWKFPAPWKYSAHAFVFRHRDHDYFFYHNRFYRYSPDRGYFVVGFPLGVVFTWLPEGYEEVVIDGRLYYRYGDVYFRRTFYGDYRVVRPLGRFHLSINF